METIHTPSILIITEQPSYTICLATINLLLRSYVLGIPCQFVKTTDEIKASGKNPSDYNRQKKLNKYYTEYYKEAFETINYYKQKYT